MKRSFEAISDAGHGWAKVDFDTLTALGFDCSDFTSCSYLFYNRNKGTFNNYIYLEEDCDLTKFVQRYEQVNGCTPKFRTRHCEHSALRYDRRFYPNVPSYKSHIRHAIAGEAS